MISVRRIPPIMWGHLHVYQSSVLQNLIKRKWIMKAGREMSSNDDPGIRAEATRPFQGECLVLWKTHIITSKRERTPILRVLHAFVRMYGQHQKPFLSFKLEGVATFEVDFTEIVPHQNGARSRYLWMSPIWFCVNLGKWKSIELWRKMRLFEKFCTLRSTENKEEC